MTTDRDPISAPNAQAHREQVPSILFVSLLALAAGTLAAAAHRNPLDSHLDDWRREQAFELTRARLQDATLRPQIHDELVRYDWNTCRDWSRLLKLSIRIRGDLKNRPSRLEFYSELLLNRRLSRHWRFLLPLTILGTVPREKLAPLFEEMVRSGDSPRIPGQKAHCMRGTALHLLHFVPVRPLDDSEFVDFVEAVHEMGCNAVVNDVPGVPGDELYYCVAQGQGLMKWQREPGDTGKKGWGAFAALRELEIRCDGRIHDPGTLEFLRRFRLTERSPMWLQHFEKVIDGIEPPPERNLLLWAEARSTSDYLIRHGSEADSDDSSQGR